MHLATKYKQSVWFVQEVGVLSLRVKEHTCSLKIICLNFRKGEMRLLFLVNQKLNLNTPLPAKKKQQQHKHDHVHIAFCQVQRFSLEVT